jgi:membrane protein DedA with SNARE-associated domain
VTPLLAAEAGGGTGLTGLAGFVADTITTLGAVGVGLLVALENLFPPIPSEVVLPLAGFLAGQGQMPVVLVIVAATVGSVVGALLLYWAGAALGRRRLRRTADRMPLVEVEDLERAESWFDTHGGRAVLIGRLIPVVRSLISVPAGVERMPLVRFTVYTTIGSAAYNTVLVLAGYLLGSRWQDVGQYSSVINYVIYAAIAGALAVFVARRLRSRRRA